MAGSAALVVACGGGGEDAEPTYETHTTETEQSTGGESVIEDEEQPMDGVTDDSVTDDSVTDDSAQDDGG
ncbi:MAG: hypothetical protein AB7S26_10535 [Sandaracinaceae bacterium]